MEPVVPGVTVYFEVIDPDDPQPYDEDTNPNDNRDPEVTMEGGTLAQYNQFQNALSSRSAITEVKDIDGIERAVAEVTLTITDQYSGDNYIVRATASDPQNKPFNANSHVTASPGADANIPEEQIESTALLTAWKRIYVEEDRMFRFGKDLVWAPGHANDNGAEGTTAFVIGEDGFEAGDWIQVFDNQNDEQNAGELLACSPQFDPGRMRVQTARTGQETLDGTTQTTQSGTDHRQAA